MLKEERRKRKEIKSKKNDIWKGEKEGEEKNGRRQEQQFKARQKKEKWKFKEEEKG